MALAYPLSGPGPQRLVRPSGAPVKLRLGRDLVRSLRRGDPWVFADALAATPLAPCGSLATLADRRGKPVAIGYYDPASPLAFRACTARRGQRVDDVWAVQGLERAATLRAASIDGSHTTGYRLVNGEGDGLPGLVVDVYGASAVLKLDGPAAEGFWDAAGVATWVAERLSLTRVYQRLRTRGGPAGQTLVGQAPEGPVTFLEHGLSFTADLVSGQKTGFFLDQRENRRLVRELSAKRRVLNVFGYTGGFSIYALAGGAEHVTTVDLAGPALEAADAHVGLNGFAAQRHASVRSDAFEHLGAASVAGETWDLVILDPPSFAPSRKSLDAAIGAYTRLIAAGARVTAPGGLLAAASCSSHVDEAAFLGCCEEGVGMARRQAALLEVRGQPLDHPVPLAGRGFRYLKFVLLRVT